MRSLANVPRSSDNHIGREELKIGQIGDRCTGYRRRRAALRAALAACDAGADVIIAAKIAAWIRRGHYISCGRDGRI